MKRGYSSGKSAVATLFLGLLVIVLLIFSAKEVSSSSNASTINSNLTIWDDSDSITTYANLTKFYANFTNLSEVSINGSGQYCEFRHNKTGNWVFAGNMSFNASNLIYEFYGDCGYLNGHSCLPVGNYSYNITCYDLAGVYQNVSTVDSTAISSHLTSLTVSNESAQFKNSNHFFYANFTRLGGFGIQGVKSELGNVVWNTSDIDTSQQTVSLAFYDIDSDGYKDELLVGGGGTTGITPYYNNGTRYYGGAWPAEDPSGRVYNIIVADFNNDSYLNEFAISDDSPSARVYNSSGNETFRFNVPSSGTDRAYGLLVSDFDNQGFANDLAVTGGFYQTPNHTLTILNSTVLNMTNWAVYWNFSDGEDRLISGDFDRDGNKNDLFFTERYLLNENGSVMANITMQITDAFISMGSGDIDHDGFEDEAIIAGRYSTTYTNYIYIYEWNGTWDAQYNSTSYNSRTDLYGYVGVGLVTDLDEDGYKDDIIVGEQNRIEAFDNNSNLLWNFSDVNLSDYIYQLKAADLNGDGYKEIIAGGNDDVVWVLNQSGTLLWKFIVRQSTMGSGYSISGGTDTGDINEDGLPDFAMTAINGYGYVFQDSNCQIVFNDTNVIYNMSWNQTSRRWETNRSFNSSGSYAYNITCSKGGYETQTSANQIITVQEFVQLAVDTSADSSATYSNWTAIYANYSYLGLPATNNSNNNTCQLRFNVTGNWSEAFSMAYNSTLNKWQIIADGSYLQGHMRGLPSGNYSLNITCNSSISGSSINITYPINVSSYATSLSVSNDSVQYNNQRAMFFANYSRTGGYGIQAMGSEIGRIIWNRTTTSGQSIRGGSSSADIDNDGYKDEFVTNDYLYFEVYENNGSLKFNAAKTTSGYAWDIRGGDFDHDGYQDDFVTGDGQSLLIYNNTGNIWFNASLGSTFYSVETSDLNNDGMADLIAVGSSNISIFNYTGSTWENIANFTLNDATQRVEFGDFDLDGRNDEIIAVDREGGSSGAGDVYVLYENGSQIWNITNLGDSSFFQYDFDVGDQNRDGYKNEIILGTRNRMMLINSSGTNIWNSSITDSSYFFEIRFVDLNSDGYKNEVMSSDGGSYLVAVNSSGGKILTYSASPVDTLSLSSGDIDNDGTNEIVAGAERWIYLLDALSNSSLWAQNITGTPGYDDKGKEPGTAILDINKDGISDIAVGTQTPRVYGIQDVNCQIVFNDSSIIYNMTWNVSSKLWEFNRTFNATVNYSYNITCSKGGYVTQTIFTNISVNEIPPWPCDSGDLNTTCYVNSTKILNYSSNISGAGNLVLQNAGSLLNDSGINILINLTGNLTIETGGNISLMGAANTIGSNLTIIADNINIASGSFVSVSAGIFTQDFATGKRGGILNISANTFYLDGNISLNGANLSSYSLNSNGGNAGEFYITLRSSATSVFNGSISAIGGGGSANGCASFRGREGNGGTLIINSSGNVTLAGIIFTFPAGRGTCFNDTWNNSLISAYALDFDGGSDVRIAGLINVTNLITVKDGAKAGSEGSEIGANSNAGNITIITNTLNVSVGGILSSEGGSASGSSGGEGGTLNLTVNTLYLAGNITISGGNHSGGGSIANGGNGGRLYVTFNNSNSILSGYIFASGGSSRNDNCGGGVGNRKNGGQIFIESSNKNITFTGGIVAKRSSVGSCTDGNGGTINITALTINISGNFSVEGNVSGEINLIAKDKLYINNLLNATRAVSTGANGTIYLEYSNDLNISAANIVTPYPYVGLNNTYGKVKYTQQIANPENITWSTNITIANDSISADSVTSSQLNKTADLWIYEVYFTNPIIMKNGFLCTDCVQKNYSGGIMYFNVTGFTNYSIQENLIYPNLTIISPLNQSYTTRNILVNLTNSSNAQATWWFNGTGNVTYTVPAYFNFSEGSNSFLAYANDSLGALNTTNLTFYVDSIAPSVNFSFQNPPDMNIFSIIGYVLNISYNISDVNLNSSTVLIKYKTNSTISEVWHYTNGSADIIGYSDSNAVISAMHPYNITNSWYFELRDNSVYPATYNFDQEYMEHINKSKYSTTNQNSVLLMEFLNVKNNTDYNIFEAFINSTPGSSVGEYYYCNSSYVTGQIASSLNCIHFASQVTTQAANHSHSNSSHWVFDLPINKTTGKISTVVVTNKSYIGFKPIGAVGRWDAYYISNTSRLGAVKTSSNRGNSYTNQTYTIDSHLHQYENTDNLWYYVCANDTLGNQNCTSARYDLINLTGLIPSVIILNPTENIYKGNITINYTYYSPNSYDLAVSNISLARENGTHYALIRNNNSNNLSFIWNSALVSDGLYLIKVEVTDTVSQKGFEYSANITIDNTRPVLNLTYPSNASSFTTNNLEINYTANDTNIQACKWSSNFGAVNTTVTCGNNITGQTWSQGGNNVTIWVNDSVGNENSSSVYFFVDSIKPVFSNNRTSPSGSPTYSSLQTYQFNVTWTEASSISKAVLNFNGTNYTMANLSNEYYYNFTSLAAGNYDYYFWANDSVGNENVSLTYTFSVNKESPSFSVLITSSIVYRVASDYTASEANAGDDGCVYNLTRGGVQIATGSSVSDTSILGVGSHIYNYSTAGCQNYTANSDLKTLTISKAPGAVYVYLNNSRSNITITIGSEIYLNASLINGTGTINLSKNGTIINLGTSPLSNLTNFSSAGRYNITGTYGGDENYTAEHETFWVNVGSGDSTAPNVSIIAPLNTSNYITASVDFMINASDDTGLSSCKFALSNSLSNYTMSNSSADIYSASNSSIAYGTYIVRYYCNDTSGNVNDSETMNFYITSPVSANETTTTPPSFSSGGGASTCTTSWKCTDWSFCDKNSMQHRTCYKEMPYCSISESKPEESRECPKVLFDISTKLSIRKIPSDGLLHFDTELTNMNGTEKIDVLLKYIIYDQNDSNIYTFTETKAVEGNLNYSKDLEQLNLPAGTYRLKVVIEYGNNQVAGAEEPFIITANKAFDKRIIVYTALGTLVILDIILAIIYLCRSSCSRNYCRRVKNILHKNHKHYAHHLRYHITRHSHHKNH